MPFPRRTGFTLIELIVVVAILAILAGLGVPYYLDYATDARRSVLKQNVANFRKVLDEFKGDQGRGPFRVQVTTGAGIYLVTNATTSADCELSAGPFQILSGEPKRRGNLKYLPQLPRLEDVQTGEQLFWTGIKPSAYFFDDDGANDLFNIDKELAFIDEDPTSGAGVFDGVGTDTLLYNFGGKDPLTYSSPPSLGKALDFVDVQVIDKSGVSY